MSIIVRGEDTEYIVRAKELAIDYHAGQTYGRHPYTHHLEEVAQKMWEILQLDSMCFYSVDVALAGAWLHDALEDTKLTQSLLHYTCGPAVLKLVLSVTDCPGPNRQARKYNSYPRIRAGGPLSVALKLADRISNVKAGIVERNAGLHRMYQKEQPTFAGALYRFEDGLDSVWGELDGFLKD